MYGLLLLSVSGCATTASVPTAIREVVWRAAQECAGGFPGVQLRGVDRYGRLQYGYRSVEERDRFLACVKERAAKEVAVAAAPGRVAAGPAERTSVPLRVAGNLLLVPVTANTYDHLTLLLDTGASRTILTPRAAESLGIVTTRAPRWPVIFAGGKTDLMQLARLQSLRVGDLVVEDIDVGVYDLWPGTSAVDGLLGGDFLGHFRLSIDRAAQRLELEVR